MASDGADVTCCGRPFQTRRAATGKAPAPTVDSCVRRTTSDEDEVERQASGRVHRRGTALVHEQSQLAVDPLRRPQPVQLTEEYSVKQLVMVSKYVIKVTLSCQRHCRGTVSGVARNLRARRGT